MSFKSKYDIIAFDVDGTLVDDTIFIWETLHNYFKTPQHIRKAAYNLYMSGAWNYEQWFQHDMEVLTYAGADRESIERAMAGMKLSEGAIETLEVLKKTGARLVVLSGSLDFVLKKFRLDKYFDEIYLNHVEFDGGGKIVGWKHTPYDVFDKATGLREIAARRGVDISRTAFIGDNSNDVAVAKVAGLSLAFQCKSQELADVVTHVVDGNDLTAVLPWLVEDYE